MNRPRTCGLVVCLALLASAGCGGGSDKENAEGVVRDIVEASGQKDADKFCGLATKRLLEQLTGAKGDKSEDACKKLIDSRTVTRYELSKIVKTEVEGDQATVTVELKSSDGRKRPQVFKLKKEDGEFKLASAGE